MSRTPHKICISIHRKRGYCVDYFNNDPTFDDDIDDDDDCIAVKV
jgi:hypothetical protein